MMVALDLSSIASQFDGFLDFKISGPIISSLTIMVILAIVSIIVGIKARHADPKKAPRGLLLLIDSFVSKMDEWTKDTMGRENVGNWPA